MKDSPEQVINPCDLVEIIPDAVPVRIELAYARRDNLLFGERIYRADAGLWLHRRLAGVVVQAAEDAAAQGFRLALYDGLRTVDAQGRMLETRRVRDNPQWLEEPRLLSPPGAGAHPRGMAIDCSLETVGGALLDMGTPFDDLSARAHRDYSHSPAIMKNRARLDTLMLEAAARCGEALLPLPQEWWDFRLPSAVYEAYAPLSDTDLPSHMRCL